MSGGEDRDRDRDRDRDHECGDHDPCCHDLCRDHDLYLRSALLAPCFCCVLEGDFQTSVCSLGGQALLEASERKDHYVLQHLSVNHAMNAKCKCNHIV